MRGSPAVRTAQVLVTGGTVVFVDRFEPVRVLDTIERERITFFMHAPVIYHMLMTIGQSVPASPTSQAGT